MFRPYGPGPAPESPLVHRVHHPDLPDTPGSFLNITGEEAHHAARVKRAGPGDKVELLDGRGRAAFARITDITKDRRTGEWSIQVQVETIRRFEALRPRLEVWASPAKGPRLEDLIDGLSQVGAAAWAPLHTRRTVVDPREGKLERLHRLAAEASKQCARAWHLEILPGGDLAAALAGPPVILADASGPPYHASGADSLRLLIGPEGGWTPDELARARAGGARVHAFGPHIMRIETAAVVAAGIVLDRERSLRGES